VRLAWLRVSSAVDVARLVPLSPLTGFVFALWVCSSPLVRLGSCPFNEDAGVASCSARDRFVLVLETVLNFFTAVEDMKECRDQTKLNTEHPAMNIPPFTSSHSLFEQQTVAVDRATLFPQSTRPVVDDDKLKQLNELVKANLDVDVPHARKRRKLSSSGKRQSTLQESLEPARKSGPICLMIVRIGVSQYSQAFRLISMANGPKVISLEPKPLPVKT
jgi:hypothetical protein